MTKTLRMTRPVDEGRTEWAKARITPAELAALDAWCDREERSRGEAVRRGLQLLLANEKKGARR
jgi:hypothetical protein